MVIRQRLRPHKVMGYIWKELTLGLVASSLALWLSSRYHFQWLGLNYAPFAVLGTALSIFLAFRTNSAYARWNQAAQAVGTMQNASRVFVRLIKTVTDGHSVLPNYDKKRSDAFIQEMGRRQIAWLHAVRLSLRDQSNWDELEPYLDKKEFRQLLTVQNKPIYLLSRQGERIYQALGAGILQGFDSFQLEVQLAALANAHATADQIKKIGVPRPYGFFTHIFVQLYIIIAPAFLLGLFAAGGVAWMVIPMTVLIAFLFAPIDGLGGLIEQPFANAANDVPITAITRDAERDILELLGETELPAPAEPDDGYLY